MKNLPPFNSLKDLVLNPKPIAESGLSLKIRCSVECILGERKACPKYCAVTVQFTVAVHCIQSYDHGTAVQAQAVQQRVQFSSPWSPWMALSALSPWCSGGIKLLCQKPSFSRS